MKRVIFVMAVLCLFSCKKQIKEDNNEEARSLFEQTSALLIDYTYKIKAASDSLEIDSIRELLEKRLVDVNFSVHPGTDYKLTEEENDSLFRLMNVLNEVSNARLKDLSIQLPDSIAE